MEPGSLGEELSVDCVLMSTCVLGDPLRYYAAWVLNSPGQSAWHCNLPPGPVSMLGSSIGDYANSGCIVSIRSANTAPSSSPLSES
jgi:hypothetical protein